MTKEDLKPVIMGTRTGYMIRFTCPACHNENSIVYHMPKDYYKDTRDATCARCRQRSTVLTPSADYRQAGLSL
jgi:transcription elongation factor Elf1